MEKLKIRSAIPEDVRRLEDFVGSMGHHKDYEYFPLQLEKQKQGERLVLVAEHAAGIAGFCILNWQPKYMPFRKLNIPEIQDLNIHPDLRRRGFATHIIQYCEHLARQNGCESMGIGVGVYSSYGPAQRLYVKLGYVPDGQGLNYDRQPLSFGEFRPVDDELCLMLLKNI